MQPRFRTPEIIDAPRQSRLILRASLKTLLVSLVFGAIIAAVSFLPALSPETFTLHDLAGRLLLVIAPALVCLPVLLVGAPIAFIALRIGWAGSWIAMGGGIAIALLAFALLPIPFVQDVGMPAAVLFGDLFALYFWQVARRFDPDAFGVTLPESD